MHLPSGLQLGLRFAIPAHWPPEQAFAVAELLDELCRRIGSEYQLPLHALGREPKPPAPAPNRPPNLRRFLQLAQRDTSGSRRLAQVLLGLWDGARFRVDLQDLLNLDPNLFDQTLHLLRHLYHNDRQLDSILSYQQMLPVIQAWGPSFDIQIP